MMIILKPVTVYIYSILMHDLVLRVSIFLVLALNIS